MSYTHYSYLIGPKPIDKYIRQPTGMFDLSSNTPHQRRLFIENLMGQGQLLAKLPYADFHSVSELNHWLGTIGR